MKQSMEVSEIKEPLLKVRNLSKHFTIQNHWLAPRHVIKAVDDISFDLYHGETLGLIGESGSGKTTLSHLILNLAKPDGGTIYFKDENLGRMTGKEHRAMRRELQMVFQSAYGALDPLKTVYDLVSEGIRLYKIPCEKGLEYTLIQHLEHVGLSKSILSKRPGQLSGGQRQRVGIARALAVRPSVLILDEPVSALDVSVQGQIVNLLSNLKQELGLTYLFITHDLDIACHLSDRLAVMREGRIVEIGETERIMNDPKAEYTRQLMASMEGGDVWTRIQMGS